jgi:gliding motility-associated-like protein
VKSGILHYHIYIIFNMNKIYKRCLIYLVFLLSTSPVFASHIMGMDLSFTCKGKNAVTFTLHFYRDCAGVAPNVQPLYIQSVSHNYLNSIALTQVGTPVDISPLCAKDIDSSTCYDPRSTLPGAQDWIFQGTVVLPYTAHDWVFYYDDEARNAAITTILNPGNTGIRIKDSLDNTSGQCVNSPIFSNPPVPYVCSNNPCTYNHGGYDPDGDSLSYELVSPEDQYGNPVQYINGLSYDSVLIEQPGVPYSLNPVTGQLSFTPLLGSQQITVTAVRIYYYSGGKVIGYVTRDIEIIVRDCTNTAPYSGGIQNLSGGGLTGPNSFTLCANTNTAFQITAKDTDLPSEAITVTTNANLVLPGAIVTLTDTNPVFINFSWSPTDADTGYHNFTVSLKNDFCPIYAVSVYSYQIYVSASTFAAPGTTICQGQSTQLSATGGRNFVWTPTEGLNDPDTSSPIATPTITTSYVVTSNLTSLCKNKDTVVVIVQLPFTVNINADAGQICPGTLTPLSAVTSGGSGSSPYTYSWTSSPPGFTSTSASISDTPKVPTTYYVVVQNGPCSNSTSFTLNIDTTANASFAVKDTVCASQQYVVTYTGHSPSNATFNWSFNGGTVLSGSGRGPYLIDYLDPGGPYAMSLKVTNPDDCSDFQTKNIYVGTPFSVAITGDPTICRTSSTTLTPSISGGGNNGAYNYIWTSTPTGFSSNSAIPIVSPTYTTTYHVLSQSSGCSDTSSFTVAVDSNALAAFAAIDTVCMSEPFNITFQGYSQAAAQFTWAFGGGTVISGSGIGPYNVSYPTSGSHKVSLLITNPDGCTDSSSENVYVAVPFNIKITGDTIVCPTYSATLGIATTGGTDNPYTYSWKSNPPGFSSSSINPIVTPVGTTTYYVLAQSKTGCVDSAAFVLRVDSLANSRFSIPDTACVNEQFNASYTGTSPENSQYNWTFSGANVIAGTGNGPYLLQYSTGGIYKITLNVVDSFECSDTSSKDIFIQPLPQDTFSASPRIGCEPSVVSFSISATAGSTFSWNFGDGTGSALQNPTHAYKHGIYTVTLTVTDKFGCIQTYTQQNYITADTSVIAAFKVNADTSTLYDFTNNNFQFTNQSKYASTYTWYFDDGATSTEVNPTHTYKVMGNYYIELIACDSLGCCDTTTFGPIHISNLNDFYLPGAFTPQGDKNNHFHILGYGLTDVVLKVYNRWGELIWQGSGADATDANAGWDGTYNGKLQPMGTYVWYATAVLGTGKTVTIKGNVTLVR